MTDNNHKFNFENVFQARIEDLLPDPDQARKFFNEKAHLEMVQSILAFGVINPLIVSQVNDKWKIVCGERRYRAAKDAGLVDLPVRCLDQETSAISLIENIQRENLLPMEKAEGLQRLKSEHHYTHEKLAAIIGKSVPTVSEILTLTRLPDDIKKECCSDNRYVHSRLLAIAKMPNHKSMRKMYEKYKAELCCTLPPSKQLSTRSKFDGMISRIGGILTQINDVDLEALNTNECLAFAEKLDELIRAGQKKLNKSMLILTSEIRTDEEFSYNACSNTSVIAGTDGADSYQQSEPHTSK